MGKAGSHSSRLGSATPSLIITAKLPGSSVTVVISGAAGVPRSPTGRLLPPDAIARELNAGTFAPSAHTLSRNCFAARTGKIELRDTKRRIAVVYAVDRQFPFRLIYGQAGGYICLEPMTCMANCQNAPFERALAGFDCIPPGETKTYRSQIYLRDFYGKAL